MRWDSVDQRIGAALRLGLDLTQPEEDAMWGRFLARRAAQADAWRAFASVMAVLTAGIRRATDRRAWLPLLTAMQWGR